jgi:excisionase family DNA binding protein
MIDLTKETPITLMEAAEKLKVTTLTVRRWIAAKGRCLESTRVGGRRLTSLEALQRFTGQPEPVKQEEIPVVEFDTTAAHEEAMAFIRSL